MTKSALVQDMRRFVGGSAFIRRFELAQFMHRSDAHSVDKFLHNIDRIDGNLFYVQDVAEAVINEQKT